MGNYRITDAAVKNSSRCPRRCEGAESARGYWISTGTNAARASSLVNLASGGRRQGRLRPNMSLRRWISSGAGNKPSEFSASGAKVSPAGTLNCSTEIFSCSRRL